MARSTGKKIMNTGVRIVPRPNPEKKVRIAAKNATNDMMTISIVIFRKDRMTRPPIPYPYYIVHRSFFLCLIAQDYWQLQAGLRHLSRNKILLFLLSPEYRVFQSRQHILLCAAISNSQGPLLFQYQQGLYR